MMVTDPDLFDEPQRQALQEYQSGHKMQVEPSIFTELAQKMSEKHEAEDEESVWEEVDIAVHSSGDMISPVSKSPF